MGTTLLVKQIRVFVNVPKGKKWNGLSYLVEEKYCFKLKGSKYSVRLKSTMLPPSFGCSWKQG